MWPRFEECGCERTGKEELVAKSIIKKVVEVPDEAPAVEAEQRVSTKAGKPKFNATKPSSFVIKPAAQITVAEYSRPGSAYVKRDAGAGLPPPPPTRAGRPLAHGQATRRVREGASRAPSGVATMQGKGGSNDMMVVGRGNQKPPSNFNMMSIA